MKTARVSLMALVAAVLATGTILEKVNPEVHIYTSWWFIALMAIVAAAAIVSLVHGKMWRRPSLLLVHASVPVILMGGALTTWTGVNGSMTLQPGVPTAEFDGHRLPFSVTLEHFDIIPYTGTHTPMDFVSHVTVEGQPYDISMNNILKHRGYRFYQEDYGDDGSSVLSVSHDPWGIGVTYCGYAMLLLGLIGMLASPKGRFRQLLKGTALIALLLMPSVANAAPQTLPRTTAEKMGKMYVLYKGRVCPMQTLAKDFTTKLTGNATYQGLTPEQVFSGYLFYYSEWANEPAIKVKNGKWKEEIGITGNRVSMMQLLPLDTVRISPMADKNLRTANEKYSLVRSLLSGRMLKMYPIADSTGMVNWYGQNDPLPMNVSEDEYLFVRRSIGYFQELVVRGEYDELERAFDKTRLYQEQRVEVNKTRVQAEHLYNALTTGRWLAMLSITLGLLAFAYAMVRQQLHAEFPRWIKILMTFYIILLTSFLLLVFILRWVVGGHAPMAGGFDSMNLMTIVIGIVSLLGALTSRQHTMMMPAGMMAMGFCLLVAMMSGSNPPVTNLMPVLNSPLLTLHVAVIMCSYALFFFVAWVGLAGLITGDDNYRHLNLVLLYPAVALLAAGIIIGAVWANISWGNYWSWDPKEVWALITLIVYAIPLHRGILTKPRAFGLYCLLAFLSVVITYFGVNLILGGMHAYN